MSKQTINKTQAAKLSNNKTKKKIVTDIYTQNKAIKVSKVRRKKKK